MSAELSGKIDAFLRKAHPYGFAANIQTVTQLFDKAAQDLFHRRRKRGGKGGHLPPPPPPPPPSKIRGKYFFVQLLFKILAFFGQISCKIRKFC